MPSKHPTHALLALAVSTAVVSFPDSTWAAGSNGVQKARFKVTVEGVQRSSWTTNHPGGPGCDSAVTGSGTETVRFSSRPVRVTATVLKGLSAPTFTRDDGRFDIPTARLRGRVTRAGDLVAEVRPQCGGTGGGSGPRDCGSETFSGVDMPLAYRLNAKPRDQLDLVPEVIGDPFANCPSGSGSFPQLISTVEGDPVRARLPRSELFDKGLGKIIVIARAKASRSGEHTSRTRTRWVVTFTRLR